MIWRAACHRKLALKYIKSAIAITHRGNCLSGCFYFMPQLQGTGKHLRGKVDENTGPDDGC